MKDIKLKKVASIVIVALASLIIISLFLYTYQVKDQQLLGKLINLSGRQRMLSQKLTKNCIKLFNNRNEKGLIAIVNNDVKEFKENLEYLELETPEDIAIAQSIKEIKPNFTLITKAVEQLSEENNAAELAVLNKAERSFLLQMDDIVAEYQQLLEGKQVRLENSIYIFSLIMILSLVLIGYFVLLPAVKKSNRYNASLISKNEELESFVYIASHDLQEPLTTIIGFTSMIETEYKSKLDENGQKMLKHISNSSIRMRDLIKSLLDYSRLQIEKTKEEIDVADLISEIETELEPFIESKKATITYENLLFVEGNKIEIRILFQNLILNAIKYKNENIDPIVNISSKDIGSHIQYTVKDNGVGIDPKYFNQIFKMFQKLSPVRESESMGMGLTHCKKIVENHYGEIRVESEPLKGSSFIFTISK